jgi:hypothetical protein
MDAEEITKKYLAQAELLNDFILNIDYKDYNNVELKEFLKVITQSYIRVLIGLSFYAPFFSKNTTKCLPEKISEFSEPPFEKDFFNSNH